MIVEDRKISNKTKRKKRRKKKVVASQKKMEKMNGAERGAGGCTARRNVCASCQWIQN
jgi:hypothetical protein